LLFIDAALGAQIEIGRSFEIARPGEAARQWAIFHKRLVKEVTWRSFAKGIDIPEDVILELAGEGVLRRARHYWGSPGIFCRVW